MALPKENLDNKSFDEFLQEALAAIPVHAPDWTDHNVHDPGITLIELFAWLAEIQLYRLNRISHRHYLKFLKLLGIKKLPAASASVNVSFTLSGPEPVIVPGGTVVAAVDEQTGKDIVFETRQQEMPLTVGPAELQQVLGERAGKFLDYTSANLSPNTFFSPFGDDPQKDDRLYFGFSHDLFQPCPEDSTPQYCNLAFELMTEAGQETERLTHKLPATLIWEYSTGEKSWMPLDNLKVIDETDAVTRSGNIWLPFPAVMAKPAEVNGVKDLFWLRLTLQDQEYYILPQIRTVRLNTVAARQQSPVKTKSFSSSGLPHQSLTLPETPVLPGSIVVCINNDQEKWYEKDDLDASAPGDRHYTVDYDQGSITFGDGERGRVPPAGDGLVTVTYRTGGGNRGNVKARGVTRILEPRKLAGLVQSDNHAPGAGGSESETLEQALRRVQRELKSVTRAVTSADYEYLALQMPGQPVARVKALPGYHPCHQDKSLPGIVSVIVVPQLWKPAESIPYKAFLNAVAEFLGRYRLLTTEVFVLLPQVIKVDIKTTVFSKPTFLPQSVADRVKKEITGFLDPLQGGPDRQGWPFGRPVYRSELFQVIDGVEGVEYVEKLQVNGSESNVTLVPADGLVYSGTHEVTAQEMKESEEAR